MPVEGLRLNETAKQPRQALFIEFHLQLFIEPVADFPLDPAGEYLKCFLVCVFHNRSLKSRAIDAPPRLRRLALPAIFCALAHVVVPDSAVLSSRMGQELGAALEQCLCSAGSYH